VPSQLSEPGLTEGHIADLRSRLPAKKPPSEPPMIKAQHLFEAFIAIGLCSILVRTYSEEKADGNKRRFARPLQCVDPQTSTGNVEIEVARLKYN
jgi:hypothetical protein